jgi:hypothetical protein
LLKLFCETDSLEAMSDGAAEGDARQSEKSDATILEAVGVNVALVKSRSAASARLPDFVEPMKAKLVDSIRPGDWLAKNPPPRIE